MVTRKASTRRVPSMVEGRRSIRRPTVNFHLRTKPFQIQPFALLPVLPGETMRSSMLQSRVVSAPIKNPLIGWWKQYGWFYVKHRDIIDLFPAAQGIQDMMVDTTIDNSALMNSTQSWPLYTYPGTMPWVQWCLAKVVHDFFRNEGEAWDDYTLDGLPIASIRGDRWWNSLTDNEQMTDNDVDVDLNDDGTITVGEIDRARQQYELLQLHGLVQMSYEDYLATFGIRRALAEVHKSELLRYAEEWTYPTNTIDPTTGAPSSAVSWAITERADKDRFFSEPGFILGVTITRPKVYFRNQLGGAAGMMNDALSWLPAMLATDKYASYKFQANADSEAEPPVVQEGPISTTDPNGYWVDLKDLLIYGDQFINFDPAEVTDANFVDLPSTDLDRSYVDSDDVNALFTGTARISEDGILTTMIAGHQRDTSPRTPSPAAA